MPTEKQALLLDMNSTFMFGEDRFGENEDFSKYYQNIGGKLKKQQLNKLIRNVYNYLDEKYPDEQYRHSFPSLTNAINIVKEQELSNEELEKIIDTFSFHEHGYIPEDYVDALFKLNEKFILSVVIDIWSPKQRWLNTFKDYGLNTLFSASSFSSDHGMVKPSPKPFEYVVQKLNLPKEYCVVIGDSIRRDLGGSIAAGIDCILVGGAQDGRAFGTYSNLLEFCDEL